MTYTFAHPSLPLLPAPRPVKSNTGPAMLQKLHALGIAATNVTRKNDGRYVAEFFLPDNGTASAASIQPSRYWKSLMKTRMPNIDIIASSDVYATWRDGSVVLNVLVIFRDDGVGQSKSEAILLPANVGKGTLIDTASKPVQSVAPNTTTHKYVVGADNIQYNPTLQENPVEVGLTFDQRNVLDCIEVNFEALIEALVTGDTKTEALALEAIKQDRWRFAKRDHFRQQYLQSWAKARFAINEDKQADDATTNQPIQLSLFQEAAA